MHPTRLAHSRWLARGESLIAWGGIAFALILLAALGSAAWWSAHTKADALDLARREQVRVVTELLSQSAEPLLASDELSPLRRLLIDARRDYNLNECSIAIGEGKIIADADPSRINLLTLPPVWRGIPLDVPAPLKSASEISINRPLRVPGRGVATMHVKAGLANNSSSQPRIDSVTGLIGGAALLALLLVYRHGACARSH
jgi:hypothetical protein